VSIQECGVVKARLNVLYVGDVEKGRALQLAAQRRGWHVYLPAQTLEALGMYITYYPDMVVIDPNPTFTFATEVLLHLRSIGAAPVLVLSEPHTREQVLDKIEETMRLQMR
jgi:DNA-binding response OmpR family regulator